MSDLKKEVFEKVEFLKKEAKQKGYKLPEDLGFEFEVLFNINATTFAGQATYKPKEKTMAIRIHNKALEVYKEKYIEQVLTHEFVHIIQFCNFKNSKAHGNIFKNLMREFGAEPERCCNFNLKEIVNKKKRKTFKYKCSCSTYDFTSIRHNRVLSRKTTYRCRKCNAKIQQV
jgi:SprT protein